MIWLSCAIPAQVSCSVRIAASECGVKTVGNAVVAAVPPVNVPAIDRASPIVGYFYSGGKSIIPLTFYCVLASSIRSSGKSGYRQ